MSLVAERFAGAIKDHGPDAVAYYGSGQCLSEESYLANRLFKGGQTVLRRMAHGSQVRADQDFSHVLLLESPQSEFLSQLLLFGQSRRLKSDAHIHCRPAHTVLRGIPVNAVLPYAAPLPLARPCARHAPP